MKLEPNKTYWTTAGLEVLIVETNNLYAIGWRKRPHLGDQPICYYIWPDKAVPMDEERDYIIPLPDWRESIPWPAIRRDIEWIAMDASGKWFGYENRPDLHEDTWYFKEGAGSAAGLQQIMVSLGGLELPTPDEPWYKTLTQREGDRFNA